MKRGATHAPSGADALHAGYERALARALRADDPVASLRAAALASDCTPALRRCLLAACKHEAGLRMSALLCTRLRFERLLQGSTRALALFGADGQRFAQLFRSYHRDVTPSARGPRSEAALFESWLVEHERNERSAPTLAITITPNAATPEPARRTSRPGRAGSVS